MKKLLEKVSILRMKYDILKQGSEFNIFPILRKISDEVNLHSQLITELLNPYGRHKKNDKFLKIFLKSIQSCKQSSKTTIDFFNNFDIENSTGWNVLKESDKIDIQIRNRTHAIIIENKIWAQDQPKQLKRYHDKIFSMGYQDDNIAIIYLTLDGREPTEYTLGELEVNRVISLSYQNDISKWIDLCIKESSTFPALRETLVQYQQVIAELTGGTIMQQEVQEMLNLFSENEQMPIDAYKIAFNWIHVKWHTEYNFWNELEKAMGEEFSEFKIIDTQKFSSDKLDNVIHGTRNKNPYFGIMLELKELEPDGDKLCFYIERTWGPMMYGFTAVNNKNKRDLSVLNKHKDLVQNSDNPDWWFDYIYFNSDETKINFAAFSENTTLKLVNPSYRTRKIKQIIKKIKYYINDNIKKYN